MLLAGLLCDETVWTGVARRLRAFARVHIVSFAGFSSLQAMADHVLTVAPPRFALIGHSMGGRVALEAVRKAPERVGALGLFNTGAHPCEDHEPASRLALVALARRHGMRALAERWLPPMLDVDHPPSAAVLDQLFKMVERQTPESFAGQISALLDRPDGTGVLGRLRVPTLLMSATGDRWSPVDQHEAMLRHVPHADLAVIENASHMVPVERPDAVADAILQWLDRSFPARHG